MKNKKLKTLVFSAAFAALIFIATAVFPVPLGNGYANFGDTLIALCSFFVGPIWGFFAAGLGSALADLFLGYGIYAPATFVIKGLMAVVFFLIFRPFAKSRAFVPMTLIASIAAEAIMVCGYFAFECILYSTAGALPNIPGNLVQAAVGVTTSTVLVSIFSHNKFLKKHSSMNLGLVV